MSFNFMAAITIYGDFGAQKIKSDTASTVSPSGLGDGQGGLVCCDSWGHNESDMTE